MQILQITPLDKKRSKLLLDNGAAFALYKGEVKALALEEGKELSPGQYHEICSEILSKRAKRRLLHLLAKMGRTEAQARQKLRQGCYPEGVIEEAISYARDLHYLDDARYARDYVSSHRGKESMEKMRMDLRSKGIQRELADQALESECPMENERDLILKWVQKKNYSKESATPKEKQRIYQSLIRKGFYSDDILHVLDYLT